MFSSCSPSLLPRLCSPPVLLLVPSYPPRPLSSSSLALLSCLCSPASSLLLSPTPALLPISCSPLLPLISSQSPTPPPLPLLFSHVLLSRKHAVYSFFVPRVESVISAFCLSKHMSVPLISEPSRPICALREPHREPHCLLKKPVHHKVKRTASM